MYLVKEERHGAKHFVFTSNDPRRDGYQGKVIDGVTLDYDGEVYNWGEGEDMPEGCLGRDPKNRKHYKVFKYLRDLRSAGYEYLPGMPLQFGFWSHYAKLHRIPPDPEQTTTEEWFDYLDRVDIDSRTRNRRDHAPPIPANKSRDDVAAWVAKDHFLVDPGIQEIWYLPKGAAPDEIRLLELNDRFPGPSSISEPFPIALDLEGVNFHLLVADTTSKQLQKIKRDPLRQLPKGWSLEGKMTWRRGA